MTTQAQIGYLTFAMLNTTPSPNVYATIEEVLSLSGVGLLATQLDVTNFDSSAGTKEFIPGLLEGVEVVVECNHRPNGTNQLALIAAVAAQASKVFRLTYTGVSPIKRVNFTAACLGFEYEPSVTEQNKIRFTLKISGALS
jgi:hypothetical protein